MQFFVKNGESRTAATSKKELFVITVNGFQPLTIITKYSILDVAAILDPPLQSPLQSSSKIIIWRKDPLEERFTQKINLIFQKNVNEGIYNSTNKPGSWLKMALKNSYEFSTVNSIWGTGLRVGIKNFAKLYIGVPIAETSDQIVESYKDVTDEL